MISNSGRERAFSEFLRWVSNVGVSVEQAEAANRKRTDLLNALDDLEVNKTFKDSKLFCGELSPGCERCCDGTWSCVFLTRLCTADCFFCPSSSDSAGPFPRTSRISFPALDAYLSFLSYFGFQGVSFSGGEPLLRLDETLTWIKGIKERLGEGIYIWLYTNGDLIDADSLQALQMAGLDEIRVNISARAYDLCPAALAREFIRTVTVEIPTIPEDYGILQERMVEMKRIGVDHVNLHQLFANQNNFAELKGHDYTFLPLVGSNAPVFESEITALRLLKDALESRLNLAINYCSSVYRSRADNLAHRKRAISVAKQPADYPTERGYVRRLSLKGSRDVIDLSTALADGCLGEYILLSYYEYEIFSAEIDPIEEFFDPVEEVEIGEQFSIRIKERLVSSPGEVSKADLMVLTSNEPMSMRHTRAFDDGASRQCYEEMGAGLQEIYPSQNLLDT